MHFGKYIFIPLEYVCLPFVFILKIFFIPEWVIFSLTAGLKKITCSKITHGISHSKNCKFCSMDLSLIDLWNIRKYNYFEDRIAITNKLIEVLFKCDDWQQIKGRAFTTETNSTIVRTLKNPHLNPYYSRLEITTLSEYEARQPFEKLMLIGYKTFIKNLFKVHLYKVVIRKENICKISIKVN